RHEERPVVARSPHGRARRLGRRLAQLALGIVVLLVLVLGGFRSRTYFRETEQLRAPSRTGSFVHTPSGELRYQERGGPDGRPVLFIGGTMASSDSFLPLMDELCDQRLRCLAMDLPPFGYSERPPDADYGRTRRAARIAAFLRGLGLRDTVLVGHSFGAGPTVETAMRYPEDVTTFVLIDGALGLGSGAPPAILRAVLAVAPVRTALASATFANPAAIRASLRKFIEDDRIVTDELADRFTASTRVQGTA